MSWRTVVVTGCAKLDYKMDYLVVRKQEATSRVYLDESSVLILESTTVSLTTMLISELVKRKIKLIFCDEKHNPQSELTSYYGSHDTSVKIKNQIAWTKDIKETVWTEIVREKIKNQRNHLLERDLHAPASLLTQYIEEIERADASNREGHAAKVYFNALFGMEFTRNSEDTVNAALDYGYSIILSCFNREVVANGYITQLGLFHDNMFNQYNLASDLMEPFRILVDRKAWQIEGDELGSREKMNLVNLLNEEIIIDQKINTVSNAIKIYCKSVFDALNEKEISLIKFFHYEL